MVRKFCRLTARENPTVRGRFNYYFEATQIKWDAFRVKWMGSMNLARLATSAFLVSHSSGQVRCSIGRQSHTSH